MSVRLYVGGGGGTIPVLREEADGSVSRHGTERDDYPGFRCFSASAGARKRYGLKDMQVMLDSGAFTDPPDKRLSAICALDRQLKWERRTAELSDCPGWTVESLVSYDLLIDETWTDGRRRRERWSIGEAERAVMVTVRAAAFLASSREELRPRRPVLACQGVDAIQYAECVRQVVRLAAPGDIIGFGGWCILGRYQRLLPEFERTLGICLPMVAQAGVTAVHLFGVMWAPAVGTMLHECDRLGLTLSVDSSKPLIDLTRANLAKAGVRRTYWRDNVKWWIDEMGGLASSRHYRAARDNGGSRQLSLGED